MGKYRASLADIKRNSLMHIMSEINTEKSKSIIGKATVEKEGIELNDDTGEDFSMETVYATIGKLDEATKIRTELHTIESITYDKGFVHSNYVSDNIDYYTFIENNEIVVKKIKKNSLANDIYHTKYGDFYVENNGEFGGTVSKIEGDVAHIIMHDNCVDIIEVNDSVYIICELSHLGICDFSIHKIECFDDRYEIEHIVSGEKSMSCHTVYENNIYFVAEKSLYKIDTHNNNKVSIIDHIGYCIINNMVIHNKKAYFGCVGQIREFDLKTSNSKNYTFIKKEDIQNDWYACGMKMLDFWDKIIIE